MMRKYKLEPDEKELSDSLEKQGWVTVPDVAKEKRHLQKAAHESLRKSRRVNLRLTDRDFEMAHVMALEEGLPYQTLLASIIHKFLMGRLTERKVRQAVPNV